MKNEQFLINSILNDISEGIIVFGFDGKIILHNHTAAQILGFPDFSLRDKSIAWLMSATNANDELFQQILDAVYTKKKVVRTLPFFQEEKTVYLHITTDFLMNGTEKIGVITRMSDITESTLLFIANKRLASQVVDLMNSFVEVMVTAVEEKSAYNANHTKNMVRYAKNYLTWLDKQGELQKYTAKNTAPFLMSIWLHDIGKLLISPEVMDKPTRLGNAVKDISHRIETAYLMLKIEMLSHPEQKAKIEAQIKQLKEAENLILSANTAGFLDESTRQKLKEAAKIQCPDAQGCLHPLLSDSELESITIIRGTLTDEERKIMESHVSLTKKLLSKMEFRGEYKPVPLWAAGHHELLDGSGYPEHLQGNEISWETRLLTIIDIYDALTAEDRPYKPPVQPEKAFAILRDMAEKGKVDLQILNSFFESQAWNYDSQNI